MYILSLANPTTPHALPRLLHPISCHTCYNPSSTLSIVPTSPSFHIPLVPHLTPNNPSGSHLLLCPLLYPIPCHTCYTPSSTSLHPLPFHIPLGPLPHLTPGNPIASHPLLPPLLHPIVIPCHTYYYMPSPTTLRLYHTSYPTYCSPIPHHHYYMYILSLENATSATHHPLPTLPHFIPSSLTISLLHSPVLLPPTSPTIHPLPALLYISCQPYYTPCHP